MQCNAMQCNAMQCNAMQCNAMQCNAMQYSFYYKLTFTGDGSCLNPIDIALSAINGHNTMQYNTIQHNGFRKSHTVYNAI